MPAFEFPAAADIFQVPLTYGQGYERAIKIQNVKILLEVASCFPSDHSVRERLLSGWLKPCCPSGEGKYRREKGKPIRFCPQFESIWCSPKNSVTLFVCASPREGPKNSQTQPKREDKLS